MNKEQYNNVIEHSIVSKETDNINQLELTRDICNNMGVALPHGDVLEVSQILATDDYMFWRSCSKEEAQEYADNGVAAIAVTETDISLIKSNTGEVSESVEALADGPETTYYAYSAGTTSNTVTQIVKDGTYFLNNAQYGKYLQKENSSIKGISGLLADLGSSIKWKIEFKGSYYVIRYAADPSQYLAAAGMDSAAIQFTKVTSSTIPTSCRWKLSHATHGMGGILIKNVYNSRYLIWRVQAMLVESLGTVETDTYAHGAWRIVESSRFNDTTNGVREISSDTCFGNVGIGLYTLGKLKINKGYDNEIWVNSYDFNYSMSDPNVVVINSRTNEISAHQQLITNRTQIAHTKVTATHKITGYTLDFYVFVGFSPDVTSTPLNWNIIEGLNKPYDVWPASKESHYYGLSISERMEALIYDYQLALATVSGGSLINFRLSADLLALYLDNSGEKCTLNLTDIMNSFATPKNFKREHLNSLIEIIELVATSNPQTLKNPSALECIVDENTDFGLSIGSYSVSIACTFRKTGTNTYFASVTYELHDFYDWDKNNTNMGYLPVSPSQMWELHHGGFAKCFEVYGKETFTMTWQTGSTVDNGVVFNS